MKELLVTFARALVDEPGRVSVVERRDGTVVRLELSVAPEDRGLVIGKRGRTADALRTVLDAVAQQRGERCEMEIG